jgi:hypothetical protein
VIEAFERAAVGKRGPVAPDHSEEIENLESQVSRHCDPDPSETEEPAIPHYREVVISVTSRVEPHETPTHELAKVAARIVEAEGPVHKEEVARRITEAWGLKRCGSRIIEATERGLSHAKLLRRIQGEGAFYSVDSAYMVSPRFREDVRSRTLLRPEMLPPAELRGAISHVVSHHIGVTPDELTVHVTRVFGFQRTGTGLREVVDQQIRQMLGDDVLLLRDGKVYLTEKGNGIANLEQRTVGEPGLDSRQADSHRTSARSTDRETARKNAPPDPHPGASQVKEYVDGIPLSEWSALLKWAKSTKGIESSHVTIVRSVLRDKERAWLLTERQYLEAARAHREALRQGFRRP